MTKYLGIALAVLSLFGVAVAGIFIRTAFKRVADGAATTARLERDLAAERKAREADVAGLTALSKGMVAATNARVVDERALAETIDDEHPKPVSAGLGRFLDKLRANDAAASGRTTKAAGRAH